jgi:hypothetical protein
MTSSQAVPFFAQMLRPETISWTGDDPIHLCVTLEFPEEPRFASVACQDECLSLMRKCISASTVSGRWITDHDETLQLYAAVQDLDSVDEIPADWEFWKATDGEVAWCFAPDSVGIVVASKSVRVGDGAPASVEFVDLTFAEYCSLQLFLTCLVNGNGPEAEVGVHYSTSAAVIQEHLAVSLENMADDVFARGNAYATQVIEESSRIVEHVPILESPSKRLKSHVDQDTSVPTVAFALLTVCDRIRQTVFARPDFVKKLEFHVRLWRRFVGETVFVFSTVRYGTLANADVQTESLLSDFCSVALSRNLTPAEILAFDVLFF